MKGVLVTLDINVERYLVTNPRCASPPRTWPIFLRKHLTQQTNMSNFLSLHLSFEIGFCISRHTPDIVNLVWLEAFFCLKRKNSVLVLIYGHEDWSGMKFLRVQKQKKVCLFLHLASCGFSWIKKKLAWYSIFVLKQSYL